MKTFMANSANIKHDWYVVDATGMTLGRLATQVANVLRGKHKPTYTPHVDCGDYVIVINADKIVLSGNKWNDKIYYRHSDYNGGLTATKAKDMMKKFPTRMVEYAVRGMIPHNSLGEKMSKKLYVYAGANHPHQAQQPKELKVIK